MDLLNISRESSGMEFSYNIQWTDSFSGLAQAINDIPLCPGKICIVTDSNVADFYLEEVKKELETCFSQVYAFVIPAGEEYKNLQTIITIYEFLIDHKFDRKDMLVALGGGVTGDMTGFTAASYLRGINYIQVPTTLLSEVDSSVGGKTGVDFQQYKNMVGAFYQPRLVYMNMKALETLPAEQFASGMAEVLKSAYLRDREFALWLQTHSDAVQKKDPEALAYLIRKCCEIKAAVVAEDPKENGLRAILNLGHTLGHAVEKLKDFTLLHGQCVAIGMVAAAYLSAKKGYISNDDYQMIIDMNRLYHLPVSVEGISAEDILEATKSDKKMEKGHIKFILLKPFGTAVIDESISEEEILEMAKVITEER